MSWLFHDLVSNAPQRGKTLDLEGAIENLDWLHKEAIWLLRTWAIFETSNGYPTSSSADELRALINDNYEDHGVKVVRELAARDSVMTAFRILDGDSQGRKTLSKTGIFLRRVTESGVLIQQTSKFESSHGDFDWLFMNKISTRLVKRLSEQDSAVRTLINHRKKLKDFRDSVLAHAMPNRIFAKPNYFDLKDAIVFIVLCIMDALMLIKGTNWDAKHSWKREIIDAKQFWDRYKKGFSHISTDE
jgi:hypothetical protein